MSPIVAIVCATLAISSIAAPAAAGTCHARSGERTTALLELYTSEGCSSCPPADRFLSGLKDAPRLAAAVVPLSLHVDYWNGLGWTDPYSAAAFSERQRGQSRLAHAGVVYTPEFMLQGRPERVGLSEQALAERLAAINGRASRADLVVDSRVVDAATLEASVAVDVRAPGDAADAALFFVVFENGLVNRVAAGENGGRELHHDFVVRAWQGPIALPSGHGRETLRVVLAPGWRRSRLGVAAFVQNLHSGEVLQALSSGGAGCG